MATLVSNGMALDYGISSPMEMNAPALEILRKARRSYGRIHVETMTSSGVVTGGPIHDGSRVVVRGKRGALLGVLREPVR
jgi:hypothetical protein